MRYYRRRYYAIIPPLQGEIIIAMAHHTGSRIAATPFRVSDTESWSKIPISQILTQDPRPIFPLPILVQDLSVPKIPFPIGETRICVQDSTFLIPNAESWRNMLRFNISWSYVCNTLQSITRVTVKICQHISE